MAAIDLKMPKRCPTLGLRCCLALPPGRWRVLG